MCVCACVYIIIQFVHVMCVRYMSTQTSGWQHEAWIEIATWSSMPEIRVGLQMEVELWTRWAEPNFQFARKHFQGPNGIPGHGMREVIRHQHETGRVLWDAARADYSVLLPRSARLVDRMSDPVMRELKRKQLQDAVEAGADEYYKLFDCHYRSWMLLLWMCHGKYCASAARALGETLDIEGCTRPTQNQHDTLFSGFFREEADVVKAYCTAWGMTAAHHQEIKRMADHTELDASAERMNQLYPLYDELLANVVDPLAITDCVCELAFSHSKSTVRINMSDTRHDDDMKWVHNVLYPMRKQRRQSEEQRRREKGLTRRIGVATTKANTRTWITAAQQLCKLQSRYLPSVMKKMKIASSTTLRRAKNMRVRMLEKAKSDRSVTMLKLRNRNRRPLTQDKKAELMRRNREKNKNDEAFAAKLEAQKFSKTVNGKVSAAVSRLCSIRHWQGISGGVRGFRLNARLSFPVYFKHMDALWASKQRGDAPDDLPKMWTQAGQVKQSAILSKTIAGKYGLRAYLMAMTTGAWDAVQPAIAAIMQRLFRYHAEIVSVATFWLCITSRHNRLILRIAGYVTRHVTRNDRRKKALARARFTRVYNACGSTMSAQPLRVNKGDSHVAIVVQSTATIVKVRIILESVSETAVLTDPPCHLQLGDIISVCVSNTSGGRDNLQVRTSRTLLFHKYNPAKPVLVMEIDGVLGFVDSQRSGATGLFVPRPGAKEFLQFCSRLYNMATWTRTPGMTLSSKLMLPHPLLFSGSGPTWPDVENIADSSGCECPSLSSVNVLYLSPYDRAPNTIHVSPYTKKCSRDCQLNVTSELHTVLRTAADSTDIGSFIYDYYHDE